LRHSPFIRQRSNQVAKKPGIGGQQELAEQLDACVALLFVPSPTARFTLVILLPIS